MSKVGNTSSFVFSVLGQFCWYTANGYEVTWSPYPNIQETGEPNPENRITFKVVERKESEIDTNVKDALNLMNHLFSSLTNDDTICIERLPEKRSPEEEVVKYTITIKKNTSLM